MPYVGKVSVAFHALLGNCACFQWAWGMTDPRCMSVCGGQVDTRCISMLNHVCQQCLGVLTRGGAGGGGGLPTNDAQLCQPAAGVEGDDYPARDQCLLCPPAAGDSFLYIQHTSDPQDVSQPHVSRMILHQQVVHSQKYRLQ